MCTVKMVQCTTMWVNDSKIKFIHGDRSSHDEDPILGDPDHIHGPIHNHGLVHVQRSRCRVPSPDEDRSRDQDHNGHIERPPPQAKLQRERRQRKTSSCQVFSWVGWFDLSSSE